MENQEVSKNSSSEEYQPDDRKVPLIHDSEYITGRLEESINLMNKLSSENQKKFKRLKRIAIIIGATIPFAVTLTAIDEVEAIGWIKIPLLLYAAMGGTVLAVMNNLLKTGSYYDKWKQYRWHSEVLLREKYLYLTKMSPYDQNDAFPLIVEKVEEILSEESELSQSKDNK